jgi:hypothetical protein
VSVLQENKNVRIAMVAGRTVYAFQTGVAKKAFGLSYDQKGTNLPRDREWRAWKSFDESDAERRIGLDEAAQKALAAHGFWAPPKMAEQDIVVPAKAKKKKK